MNQLRDVLQGGRFVGGEDALERTVALARAAAPTTGPGRLGLRRIAIAIAAAAICIAILALTPPGQAATHWVSDLVSGENNFEPGQYGYQLKTSTLIGEGQLATGDRYQLRGYVGNANDGGCVAIVWEHSDRSAPTCAGINPKWSEDDVSEGFVIGSLPEDENTPGASGTYVMGTAPAQTTELKIRVPASEGVDASESAAQLFPIDGRISDTTGASATVPKVQLFVGYLPPGAGDLRTAPPSEAVAFDGDNEIGEADLGWVSFSPSPGAATWITTCVKGDGLCQTLLAHPETAPALPK